MLGRNLIRLALATGFAAGAFIACRVNLPEDGKYRCDTDKDCGTNFVCVRPADSLPYCCELGSECAPNTGGGAGGGGGPTTEICNGKDDDGDSLIDEDFNLLTDVNNCGVCNRKCGSTEKCANGTCSPLGEQQCADGVDNDSDNTTDCGDTDCENQSCGTGCVCRSGGKHESTCFGGQDEDQDTLIDCKDPDCKFVTCGNGCVCAADGGKAELSCTDSQDNDGDALTDCADVQDCVNGANCKPAPNSSTCFSGQCLCNGAPAPTTEANCHDGVDNDCSGQIDCADTNSCNGANCSVDGGTGLCICRNGQRAEFNCQNKFDDDGDGLVDCGDPTDCPVGTACKKPNGQNGNCSASQTCQ